MWLHANCVYLAGTSMSCAVGTDEQAYASPVHISVQTSSPSSVPKGTARRLHSLRMRMRWAFPHRVPWELRGRSTYGALACAHSRALQPHPQPSRAARPLSSWRCGWGLCVVLRVKNRGWDLKSPKPDHDTKALFAYAERPSWAHTGCMLLIFHLDT